MKLNLPVCNGVIPDFSFALTSEPTFNKVATISTISLLTISFIAQ
jgi:hypothetical protein